MERISLPIRRVFIQPQPCECCLGSGIDPQNRRLPCSSCQGRGGELLCSTCGNLYPCSGIDLVTGQYLRCKQRSLMMNLDRTLELRDLANVFFSLKKKNFLISKIHFNFIDWGAFIQDPAVQDVVDFATQHGMPYNLWGLDIVCDLEERGVVRWEEANGSEFLIHFKIWTP